MEDITTKGSATDSTEALDVSDSLIESTAAVFVQPSNDYGVDSEGKPGAAPKNVSLQETVTLEKGEGKTYSFDVDGGWFDEDHNTVSVVITKSAGGSYQYMSENVTAGCGFSTSNVQR